MKKAILLLLSSFYFYALALSADVKYSPFIDSQIELIRMINDENATKETIEDLLEKQTIMYDRALNKFMANKQKYIDGMNLYENEIYSLNKIIAINKRAGNEFAVLRDEIKVKCFTVLKHQNNFFKNVLLALDLSTIAEYENKLNELTAENQQEMQKIYEKSYTNFLDESLDSNVLLNVKENVRDFYALQEINANIISYLYKSEHRMYRLNKYSKYHLIVLVAYVNSLDSVQSVNLVLEEYGLSVMKLVFILSLVIIFYVLRRVLNVVLTKYILSVGVLKQYSTQILEKIHKSVDSLIMIINIELIVYLYNDFTSSEFISSAFNVIYGFYFTLIVYQIVNKIASIKLQVVNDAKSRAKSDLINVGIKVINFVIIIIGFLFMLYFAGVNLTTVLSGLGIGGLAVALAAKDTISNFFGTLSILFSDVFAQGDWIEVDGQEGVVVEIGLRVTTIRTFDNALISIPNGTFASKEVKNWNKRVLGRRIKMSIGIKYSSKTQDIKNAVNEIRSMLEVHPGIATKTTKYEHRTQKNITKLVSKDDLEGVKNILLVYLDEFSDSSINILVYCFSQSVVWDDWLLTKEDVMYRIMKILEENSLEFAFPSLSVYNESLKND